MPNLNKEPYLGQAIRSILDQDYRDFELIIVDDGSTDSSLSIVEGIQREEARIKLVKHANNRGLQAALNSGIREASSELLTFVGSDDLISHERLQRIVDHLPPVARPSVVYSDPIYIAGDTSSVQSEPSKRSFRPSGMILKYLLMGEFKFMGGPIAAPKACFDAVGPYDESLRWGEDFEMSLRLAERYPLVFDPLCTYGYRIYEGNVLGRIGEKERWGQQSRILEKYLSRIYRNLEPEERRRCFNHLFSCYVASDRWGALLSRGLTSREAFLSMISLPKRRRR